MSDAFISEGRYPGAPCPVCAATLDAATGVSFDPADPAPRMTTGDFTVCAYCGVLLAVTEVGLRAATQAEVDSLPPDIRQVVASWRPRGRG
jgi:hypothetical protein